MKMIPLLIKEGSGVVDQITDAATHHPLSPPPAEEGSQFHGSEECQRPHSLQYPTNDPLLPKALPATLHTQRPQPFAAGPEAPRRPARLTSEVTRGSILYPHPAQDAAEG